MGKTIEQVAAEARERGMTYGEYVSLTEPPEAWAPVQEKKVTRERYCPVCGKAFQDERKNIKYCSPTCRNIARSRCVIDYRKRHGVGRG